MQLNPGFLSEAYNQFKFWMPLIGAAWGIFKVVQWAKEIRKTDLPSIQSSVSQIHTELQTQTTSVVNQLQQQLSPVVKELQELRADMRTYYTVTNVPPVRYAKAKVARRGKAKK